MENYARLLRKPCLEETGVNPKDVENAKKRDIYRGCQIKEIYCMSLYWLWRCECLLKKGFYGLVIIKVIVPTYTNS